MATKRLKNRYIETLGVMTMLLALVRCAFPGIAGDQLSTEGMAMVAEDRLNALQTDDTPLHRIYSVPSYRTCFPDSNSLQLTAAYKWGVKPVKDRDDAVKRMDELVYMGASPYYCVADLDASIPYLVPRAALLLHDIGVAFFDSLQIKGVPLHRFTVTSVLRSEKDVARLRRINRNAIEQSCHLFGTTFDINYNRYETVRNPDEPLRREVSSDTLKFILSEVLRDMRQQGRCYIKYEVHQPCFHMTVR